VFRTKDIVNVRREYKSRPLIFTFLVRNVKLFKGETVNKGLVSIDNRVVAVNPNSLLVMRNRK
jgi:hypothetical protein